MPRLYGSSGADTLSTRGDRRRLSRSVVVAMVVTAMLVPAGTASAGEPLPWTTQIGTAAYDEVYEMAAAPDGSIYVAGYTDGALPGGGGNLGSFDGFLRKYSPGGTLLWTRQFGTTDGDYAYDVTVGSDGMVYVVGETGLRIDQGGDGDFDAFIRQFDADGNPGWDDTFGSTDVDSGFGVGTAPDGSVYMVGWTFDELPGGGGQVGGIDAFIRKYDADGIVQWTRQFGSAEVESAGGVAVASDGFVYVAGGTDGELSDGGGSLGTNDAFLRKYDEDGNVVWTRQYGTAGFDTGSGLAIGPNGLVYTRGQAGGVLPGGGGEFGGWDAFVRAYDANGAIVWTRQFGSSAADRAFAIAVGPEGNVYAAGGTWGALPGGGGHHGEDDAFVRAYSSTGSLLWTRQFGTSTGDRAWGLAAGPDGGVFVAGATTGAMPGGGGYLGGDSDGFLRNLASAITVGLVDPTQGRWHLRDSDGAVTSFYFGNPGDYPFMGDWNCDGIDTPGLYRQSDGFVYLRNTNTQGNANIQFFFGNPGDIPVVGDFNHDGCDTVSIYRPSNQTFYIINKLGQNNGGLGAADFSFVFGNPGDKPFVGDFNANGQDTIGLHRESTGLVYFRNTLTTGVADNQFFFGDPNDRFITGDWNVNGSDSPAVFRPGNTTFYFRYTNTQGNADAQFVWGQSGWLPVSGVFGLG